MKRQTKRFLICIIGMGILLSGCDANNSYSSEQDDEDIRITLDITENNTKGKMTDFSQGDLFTMFEEVNNETVTDFVYEDYNKDGMHEAFVVTNSDGYKLWYMHAQGCELVSEEYAREDKIPVEVMEYSTKVYLLLQHKVDDALNTVVYTVDNKDRVTESSISRKGYLSKDANKNLTLRVYGSDADTKNWCDYYLYYNPDEGFKEYGGIPIAREQFLEFHGAQDILEEIEQTYEDCEIDISYLYRSNGYININIVLYSDGKVQYKHTTLKYDNRKVMTVGDLIIDGRAETAHMLEIATFPMSFKHPDTMINE